MHSLSCEHTHSRLNNTKGIADRKKYTAEYCGKNCVRGTCIQGQSFTTHSGGSTDSMFYFWCLCAQFFKRFIFNSGNVKCKYLIFNQDLNFRSRGNNTFLSLLSSFLCHLRAFDKDHFRKMQNIPNYSLLFAFGRMVMNSLSEF